MSKKWKGYKAWFWRVMIAFDQFVNALLGPALNYVFNVDAFGDPDETISSVMGKYQKTCTLCRWLCFLLEKIDPGHCDRSIENDEGKRPE